MDSAKLNDWMQVVGIFALVASLVFVGLQMKQTQEIAAFEGMTDSSERLLAYRTILAEHADAWAKGCQGEELTPEERVQFASTYESFILSSYIGWSRALQEEFGTLDAEAVIRRTALSFSRFPALSKYADSRASWLGPRGMYQDERVVRFRELLARDVAMLEREGDEVAIDVAFCGT